MKRLVVLFILLFLVIVGYFANQRYNTYHDDYFHVLSSLHKIIRPNLYLEIGVNEGESINLTLEKTHAIGVDPAEKPKLNDNVVFYNTTSDNFFLDSKSLDEFKDKKIDVAFIDGMHLFEYVLRDFINVEKYTHSNSVIILHDILPIAPEISTRDSNWDRSSAWTGDVYKIIPILKKYRPELKITIIDAQPSGLCFVSNLNSQSTVLQDNYSKIVDEYMNYTFDEVVQFHQDNFVIEKPRKLKTDLLMFALKYNIDKRTFLKNM